jgi:hypothetical protein
VDELELVGGGEPGRLVLGLVREMLARAERSS